MKYLIAVAMCVVFAFPLVAADTPGEGTPASALLLIDIQDFYFPGGQAPLVDPEAAAANAAKVLAAFRAAGNPVVHVRHEAKSGGAIHAAVAPINGEQVFTKSEVSCFKGTDVLAHLRALGVERLVLVGMQTHMCLEAATRAASDLGFQCVVISDACATRDLTYGETTVKAADVQTSTLATIDGIYAKVVDTETFLSGTK